MAYDTSVRSKVRAKYVQGLPLNTAAEACKVPYNTARNWKRQDAESGDDWDISKSARRMSQGGIAEVTHQVFSELGEQFSATIALLKADKTMPLATRSQVLLQLGDSYVKTVAAASRAAPNLNRLATAMDVVRFLTQHMAEHAPKMRQGFLDFIEKSGDDIAREFGGGR